jgi:hypothetical protein
MVEIPQRVRQLIIRLEELNQTVARILEARSLADSYGIFDADTSYAYDTLATASSHTRPDIIAWRSQVDNIAGGAAKVSVMISDIRERIEALGNFSKSLSDELDRLAQIYSP